jgi:hypothetical protein
VGADGPLPKALESELPVTKNRFPEASAATPDPDIQMEVKKKPVGVAITGSGSNWLLSCV